MKIEETDKEIVVRFEEETVRYNKDSRCYKENYLTGEGVQKLEAWKIDLINKHGVDLDDIPR